MAWKLICMFFLACGYLHSTDGDYNYFDCRRDQHSCIGASCVGPRCAACPSPNKGFDCSVQYQVPENNNLAGCLCQNGGTCYKDSNVLKCLCPPRYYGDKCQHDRTYLSCSPKCLTIGVNPIGDNSGNGEFTGKVTATSTGTCEFTKIGSGSTPPTGTNFETGYYIHICENENTCPYIPFDGGIKINVTIQYGPGIVNVYDTIITFSCQSSGAINLVKQIGIVPKTPNYAQVSTEFTPNVTQIPVSMKAEVNNQIVTILPFGAPFNLVLEVDLASGFSAILIESLVAQNPVGNKLTIMRNGCRTNNVNARKVMSSTKQLRQISNKAVAPIISFIFADIYELSFLASVVVCVTDLDPRCALPTCLTSRTRRESESDFHGYNVNLTLKLTPVQILDTGSPMALAQDDVILVVGVVCGSVFLLSLVAIVVFSVIWKMWRRKTKEELPHKPQFSIASSNESSNGLRV